MSVWAIADLHLSFGVPNKKMDLFGELWKDHAEKIKKNWLSSIKEDDLVLLAGDISWALKIEDVKKDLDWIHDLPGTKVMIKGNHDYWWHSPAKLREIMPPSCHAIQNDAYQWNGISIGGARLWDTPEYNFDGYINYKKVEGKVPKVPNHEENAKLFARELNRLELSLKGLDQNAKMRIAMTHYPPIGPDLKSSETALLLEKYHVDVCVFGHLHNVKKGSLLFGESRGVRYFLTSCDSIDFNPIKIC